MRRYVELGGFVFAEACCGKAEFDRGFRTLIKEVFDGPGETLSPLDKNHPIWRIKHPLNPDFPRLWGVEVGDRTAVVYSPTDLSCFWNLAKTQPSHKLVVKACKSAITSSTMRPAAEFRPSRISSHRAPIPDSHLTEMVDRDEPHSIRAEGNTADFRVVTLQRQ